MVVAVVRSVHEVRRLEDPSAVLTHFNCGEGQSDTPRRVDVAQCGRPEAIFESLAKHIRAPGQGCGARTDIEHQAE